MDNTDRLLLSAVEQAYKSRDKRKHQLNDGFKYSQPFSTEYTAVYINNPKKEMIFAIKGTSSSKELLLDLKIMSRVVMKKKFYNRGQLKKLTETFLRVVKAYPGYKIYLSGHSLGGLKALYLANNTHIPYVSGTVFNTYVPPVVKPDIRSLFTENKKLKMIIVKGDPLSNDVLKITSNVVVLNPPLLKQNILGHLMDTLEKF